MKFKSLWTRKITYFMSTFCLNKIKKTKVRSTIQKRQKNRQENKKNLRAHQTKTRKIKKKQKTRKIIRENEKKRSKS